jgi:hypothetical protein
MRLNTLHFLPLLLVLVGCVKPPIITPASQAEADRAINIEKARKLSDAITDNLLKNNPSALRQLMEKGLRDYVDDAAYASLIDRMFDAYGKPLEVEYKMDELGRKTGEGGYDKPVRKFWYATRTSKYDKGTVYLIVEIVPDEGALAGSSVSLVTFAAGVPPSLK